MDQAASASASPPAPVRRKALACLPCRAAKSACEGVPPHALASHKAGDDVEIPADAPCHRCQRLAVACRWAPTKRIGRPAKRRRAAGDSEDDELHAEEHAGEQPPTAAQTAAWQAPLSNGTPFAAATALPDLSLGSWPAAQQQQQSSSSSADSMADSVAAFWASLPAGTSDAALQQTATASSPLDNVMMDPTMWNILAGGSNGGGGPSAASPSASTSASSPDRSSVMQDLQSLHDWMPTSLPQPAVSIAELSNPSHSPKLSNRAMHQLESIQMLSSTSRPSRKAGSSSARSSSLAFMDEGLVAFFTRAQQIIPLLGTSAQYAAWLSAQRSEAQMLVHHAASALGLRLAGPRAAQAAERSLSHARHLATELRLPRAPAGLCDALSAGDALDSMRGLLILATVEAGAGKPADANVALGKAARLASEWGVHRLDAPFGEASQQAPLPLAGAAQRWTAAADRDVLEGLRRAWWELYLVDSMLWIVSSGQAGAQVGSLAAQAAVDMPIDLGEEHSANPSRQSYDSRVRACALMREALVPPTPAAARSLARLAALESLAENLLLSSDARWRTARAQAKAAELEGDEIKLQAAEARAEAALMAIVTLNSGRIHLHRNATFPEVTLDFSSCAFRPNTSSHISELGDGTSSPESSPVPARDPRRVADSLRRIDAASAGILDIVREDYVDRTRARHAVAVEDETSPLLRHTPFFACSQMVAAYGHVVLLAGTRAQAEQETALRLAGRGTAEGEEALWKRRVALSDLSLAEANTAQCAMVWPLVESYVMQVRRCRAAVDFAGPLGLRDG